MKIEFHPDFKFFATIKIVWPKLRGFVVGYKIKGEEYRSMMRPVVTILSALLALVAIAILALRLIRPS
jgi:hypothetical protein